MTGFVLLRLFTLTTFAELSHIKPGSKSFQTDRSLDQWQRSVHIGKQHLCFIVSVHAYLLLHIISIANMPCVQARAFDMFLQDPRKGAG